MDVLAVASGETLNMKSETTLVGQAVQEPFRAFISILLLVPNAAYQHHHTPLWLNSHSFSYFIIKNILTKIKLTEDPTCCWEQTVALQ